MNSIYIFFRHFFKTALILITTFLIIASLIFYNNSDNTFFYQSTDAVKTNNLLGSFGANIAAILLYFFGPVIYLYIFVLLSVPHLFYKFGNLKKIRSRISPLICFLCLLSTISYIYDFDFNKNFSHHGLIGYLGGKLILSVFEYNIAQFFLFVLLMANLILLMQFNWITDLKFIFKKIKTLIQKNKKITVEIKETVSQNDITKDLFWNNYINNKDFINNDKTIEKNISQDTNYHLPILEETNINYKEQKNQLEEENQVKANILQTKLEKFGICGKIVNIINGSLVTLFEYEPSIDTKISNILSLEDDLALALQATSLRILAPIAGKSVVGFEVANSSPKPVYFNNIINNFSKGQKELKLPMVLGKDTMSNNIVIDLSTLPHLLIGGSTGAGKSVGLNVMLSTLLCTRSPQQVKLILIDPKRLEFSSYANIAHLLFEVVTDASKVVEVLKWTVMTMEERYKIMAKSGVKNKEEYSKLNMGEDGFDPMPYIVIIVDELADLMMIVGKEIETLIARLAQMARASGIHLIIATQRPSVDVITGLIKVNFPCRISFKVTSKVDSRTILDRMGAQSLLGKGDMLYLDPKGMVSRIHGAYISNDEVGSIVEQIKMQVSASYEKIEQISVIDTECQKDELLESVMAFIKTKDEISISLLQRIFKIGYNRSARIIEHLEQLGKIHPAIGSKMRKINKDNY